MISLKPGRRKRKADLPDGVKKDRRSGGDRRHGGDRRVPAAPETAADDARNIYKHDLDRHLWSWSRSSRSRARGGKRRRKVRRRRKVAGLIASAAGALGAASLSFFLYRQLRDHDRPADPEADLDEADFDG